MLPLTETFVKMIKTNKFLFSFIGLILFQIFMSFEELVGRYPYPRYIKVFSEKLHLRVPSFPVIEISTQTFMFISLVLIIVLFVFLGLVFTESKWSRIMAMIIGIIETINGGFHLFASVYFTMYIPGSISAVGVFLFGLLIIVIKPSFLQPEPEEPE